MNSPQSPYRLRIEVAALLGCSPVTSTSAVEYLNPLVTLCESAQTMMAASGGAKTTCEVSMDSAKVLRTLVLVALSSQHARNIVLGSGVLHDLEALLPTYNVHANPDPCTSHVVVHELVWCQLYYLASKLYHASLQGSDDVVPVEPPSDLYISDATRESLIVAVRTKNRHAEYLILPLLAEATWCSDGRRRGQIAKLLGVPTVFDNVIELSHACNFLSPQLWYDLACFDGVLASSDPSAFFTRLVLPHQAEAMSSISVPRLEALSRTVQAVYTDPASVPTDIVTVFDGLLFSTEPALVEIGRLFWSWMRSSSVSIGSASDTEGRVLLGELLHEVKRLFERSFTESTVHADNRSDDVDGHERSRSFLMTELSTLTQLYERPDFCIAFSGSFNSGKSTLLNTLCEVGPDSPYRLPTHWTECTSMMIEIRYGPQDRVPELVFTQTVTGLDVLERVRTVLMDVTLSPLMERLTGHAKAHMSEPLVPMLLSVEEYAQIANVQSAGGDYELLMSICDAVRVFFPSQLLRNGVRFVDCAGSMKNAARTSLTQRFLDHEADIVVYLTPAVGGWLTSDQDSVTRLRAAGKRVVVVNTKFDQAVAQTPEDEARTLLLSQSGVSVKQTDVGEKVFFTAVKQVMDNDLTGRPHNTYDLDKLRTYLQDHILTSQTTTRNRVIGARLATLLRIFSESQPSSMSASLSLNPTRFDQIAEDVDLTISAFIDQGSNLRDGVSDLLDQFQTEITRIVQDEIATIINTRMDESWVSLVNTANPETILRTRFMKEVTSAVTGPIEQCIDQYSRAFNTHVHEHMVHGQECVSHLERLLHPEGRSTVVSQNNTREVTTSWRDLVANPNTDLVTVQDTDLDTAWDVSVQERHIWRHEAGMTGELDRRHPARAVIDFVLSEEGIAATADAKTYFDVVFSSLSTAALPLVVRACLAGSAAIVGTLVFKVVPKMKAARAGSVSVFQADLLANLPTISNTISRHIWMASAQSIMERHASRLQDVVTCLVRPLQLARARLHGDITNLERSAAMDQEIARTCYLLYTQAEGLARPGSGGTLSLQDARYMARANALRLGDGVGNDDDDDGNDGNDEDVVMLEPSSRVAPDTTAHTRFQTQLYAQEVRLQNDDWTLLANRLAQLDPGPDPPDATRMDVDTVVQQRDVTLPALALVCARLCLAISDVSERLQRWGRLTRTRVVKSTREVIQKRLEPLSHTLISLCPSWSNDPRPTTQPANTTGSSQLTVTLPWFASRPTADRMHGNVNTDRVYIIISGTKRLRDLFISAQCLPTTYQWGPNDTDTISVHAGIYLSARAVFEELCTEGVIDRDGGGGTGISDVVTEYVLSGHSVGGAVATLIGMFITNESPSTCRVHAVHSYGAPRFVHGALDAIGAGDTIAGLSVERIHSIVHPHDIVPCLFGSSNARLAVMLWQQVSTLGAGLRSFLEVCSGYQPCGHLWLLPARVTDPVNSPHGPQTVEPPTLYPHRQLTHQRQRLELCPRHLSPHGIKSHFMAAYVRYVEEGTEVGSEHSQ